MSYLSRNSILILTTLLSVSILTAQNGKSKNLKYSSLPGKTLRYKQTANLATTQEFMGTEMQSQAVGEGIVVMVGEEPDGGNPVFIQTTETFTIDVTSAMMDSVFRDPPAVVGKRVRKVIRPDGDQVASVELDEFGPLPFAPGYSSEQEFFPNLPSAQITIGDSVTQIDSDTTHALGGNSISEFKVTYTYVGDTEQAGYNCAVLRMDGIVALEGDGFLRGTKFFMQGEGRLTGETLFATDAGIVVASETNIEIESTIALSGAQNMTIPTAQVVKSSIELLP